MKWALAIFVLTLLLGVSVTVTAEVVDPPQLLGTVITPNDGFDVLLTGHYALVADYRGGLHVINVADATAPAIVGSLVTPGLATHLALSGNIVFVADHAAGGVRFVNISDKRAPMPVGSYVTGNTAVMVARQEELLIVGYLEGMLELVDVTNLSSPTLIATCTTMGPPREAVMDGATLFVTDSGFGLSIFDVSTPASPTLVGSAAANRPIGIDLVDNVAYLADLGGIKSFDVSDRTAPVLLGAASLPAPGVRVRIQDSFAVLANHLGGGLQIVDVATPSAMSLVTGYVTGHYAFGVVVSGELAYLIDREGLKIFRVLDQTVPVHRATMGGVKARYRGGGGD